MESPPYAEAPLIVTLRLDEHSTAIFDELRRRHFPPRLNRIGAHLTLFHQLPAGSVRTVLADLREVAPPPFDLEVARPMLLGRGVAIEVRSARLQELHRQLAERWSEWLTPQDRQRLRPHITVQNKVDPAEARRLHAALARTQYWPTVLATGWSVWRYLGGPWLPEADVPFTRPE
ncbi:2'-5' RNA ligase family protein [Kribbella sp. CA-293567]|uniref:2'-5' RNA ligase family protein n=1 Tax=Kribbella sp. CA-293567 TaxID=3002436 RepID=UPI0022DD86A4|nr:2'-5' RNA ligase family protein [Kribbella sp. CA-293567]WBQ08281.1 2'-5' RNA ligase family protein [Kribbella sp. CA-293567]